MKSRKAKGPISSKEPPRTRVLRWPVLCLAVMASLGFGSRAAPADTCTDNGARLFEEKCGACHDMDPAAGQGLGPNLDGILGAPAARQTGFAYSENLRDLARDGLVWDRETLSAYIRKPKGVVPRGKKTLFGIRDTSDMESLVAYLAGC